MDWGILFNTMKEALISKEHKVGAIKTGGRYGANICQIEGSRTAGPQIHSSCICSLVLTQLNTRQVFLTLYPGAGKEQQTQI